MRLSLLLVAAFAFSGAQASWFGSDKPEYSTWDTAQLQEWLGEHNIKVPKGYSKTELQDLVKSNWVSTATWSQDQYEKAQKSFQGLKDSSFDAWDDSKLREFLLEQGVVAPTGPREQLVLAAKKHYRSYASAASSLSSAASATVSTAIYGDKSHQASKSFSSAASSASVVAAQASADAVRKLDDAKDYIYSTWDDNQLRTYLVEKGVIKSKQEATRDQLLAYMKDSYAAVTDPIWKAWSDSYTRDWLVAHGILKSDVQKARDKLDALMQTYYYDPKDSVWSAWSDSQLKSWLVDNGIVVDAARPKRAHMQKLVADNYRNAVNVPWESWKDSDMRAWLIKNGYLRSDAQVKRDKLVQLMNEKYNEGSARTAAYLTWPDARLRAFLRENGFSEDALPTERPGLLQETRIRYVQTQTHAEALFAHILEMINSGVEIAEEKLGQVLEILSGTATEGKKVKSASEL